MRNQAKLIRLVVLAALVILVVGGISTATKAQGSGWTDYKPDQVDGTVKEPARKGGPLPADCPVPSVKASYVIGFAQANSAEPWRTAMNQQLNDAVDKLNADMAGKVTFKLLITDAAQDNAKQVADIENFLTQKVDLLITSPNEASPLTAVINKAWKSCVPTILLDRNITNTDYSMFIGADNVAIGKSAGQFVAKYCKDKGLKPCNIFEIDGLSGTSGAVDRHVGFADGIKDNADAVVKIVQNADWLREKAVTVANPVLQANTDINVIYGENDPMAEGAYLAAKTLGVDMSKVLVIGVDGLPTPDGGIASVLQNRLGATWVYPTGGKQAIAWAKLLLVDHINPPVWLVLPFSGVTPQNAQEVCNTYHCPLEQKPAAAATMAATASK
jgi:ribose transport system substrate-binding protein